MLFFDIFNLKKNDFTLPSFYTTDLHSHLIPNIDDGSKSMEQSLEMIQMMKSIGFKKLITTPHIHPRYPNSKDTILKGLEEVQSELQKEKIDIQLEAGCEYYYDEHFIDLVKKKDLLTFGDSYILFELSYTTPVFGLERVVYEILSAGYRPILAHPERYSYFINSLDKYHSLKDTGLFFQINTNSTIGFYGKRVKKNVEYLIKENLVDFIGSDAHRPNYIEALKHSLNSKLFKSFEKTNLIKNNYL